MSIEGDKRKKLCVVFDIDETLIQFLNKTQINNTNWNAMSIEDKSSFDYVDNDGHVIFLRPYLKELFRMFNANKDRFSVALWTYSEQEYSEGIAKILRRECGLDDDFFLFTWGAEQITDDGYCGDECPKNLNVVWDNFPQFNTFNTIIVDDLYGNITHEYNIKNCVLIQPYAPFGRDKTRVPMSNELKDRALNDDMLLQLQDVCEKVSKDIQNCDEEDIDAAFKKEAVFSEKRIIRMGLTKLLKKYARKFIMVPTIGNGYQTNNFIDVTEQSNVYGARKAGGKRKRRITHRHRKSGRKTKYLRKKGGKWSAKYKRSINCKRPRGFSQRQHCKYGHNKTKKR